MNKSSGSPTDLQGQRLRLGSASPKSGFSPRVSSSPRESKETKKQKVAAKEASPVKKTNKIKMKKHVPSPPKEQTEQISEKRRSSKPQMLPAFTMPDNEKKQDQLPAFSDSQDKPKPIFRMGDADSPSQHIHFHAEPDPAKQDEI